jgi:hypothetical protein
VESQDYLIVFLKKEFQFLGHAHGIFGLMPFIKRLMVIFMQVDRSVLYGLKLHPYSLVCYKNSAIPAGFGRVVL